MWATTAAGAARVRRSPRSYPRPLTARECATLERMARGMTQKMIAFEFGVSIAREGDMLVIRIPISAPTPSSSGKTLVVASTRGNQKTGVQIDGKDLYSAYVPRPMRSRKPSDQTVTGEHPACSAAVRHRIRRFDAAVTRPPHSPHVARESGYACGVGRPPSWRRVRRAFTFCTAWDRSRGMKPSIDDRRSSLPPRLRR